MAIKDVSKNKILIAINEFDEKLRDTDEWNNWEQDNRYKFAISYNDRNYPVKKIISMATGEPLKDFSGGEKNANRYIKQKELKIIELDKEKMKINYWAARSNPGYYKLKEALKSLKIMTWTIKWHKKDIKPNDVVYLYIASGEKGIIAVGKIITKPEVRKPLKEEKKFYVDPKEAKKPHLMSLMKVEKVLKEPISHDFLSNHPVLKNFKAMKAYTGTNFIVESEEHKIIQEFIENSIVNENESVKLLLLKSQIILYGPPGTGKTYRTKHIAINHLKGEVK